MTFYNKQLEFEVRLSRIYNIQHVHIYIVVLMDLCIMCQTVHEWVLVMYNRIG